MNIVLLGMNGQLGWKLQRALAALGPLHCFCDRLPGPVLGVTDRSAVQSSLRTVKPRLVFNAAAYTNADQAEQDFVTAWRVNAEAKAKRAAEAKCVKAVIMHYPTNYVFDGRRTARLTQLEPMARLNGYGERIFENRSTFLHSYSPHTLFRTSRVFGAHGRNFLKTVLQMTAKQEKQTIVASRVGSHTFAALLSDASAHAAMQVQKLKSLSRIFHAKVAGETSWHSPANHLFDEAKALESPITTTAIEPVRSSVYTHIAKSHLNSQLDCRKFVEAFGLHLLQRQAGVKRTLVEILRSVI